MKLGMRLFIPSVDGSYSLMDYLDDRARMDSPFKERVLWDIDVEEPDGSENYDCLIKFKKENA